MIRNFNNQVFENKTLLVVDDDPQNRSLIINLMLQMLPATNVLTAIHGKQALQVLEKKGVDVILLDWEMPEMNGLDLLHCLQKHQDWNSIPVIIYTGAMIATSNLAEALEAGAWDFLRKPTEPLELIARLRAVFRQKEAEKARAQVTKDLLAAEKMCLQKELDLTKQEINNYLLLLNQKNTLLLDIKGRCEDKKSDNGLISIAKHIDKLLNQEDYWSDLIGQFNKTDQSFIQKLLNENPDISLAETKLALLIRLGMDNKVIANLLNISSDGVKKSRYRLRKKLNMEQEDSLDKFILGL